MEQQVAYHIWECHVDEYSLYKIYGSHSDTAEDSNLLVCYQ